MKKLSFLYVLIEISCLRACIVPMVEQYKSCLPCCSGKTVLLVYNDMDGGLRNTEPSCCRADGGLIFDDVQGQALGPLLHVSLHSITLPTPCGHSAEPDVVHVYVMWGRKIPFLRGSAVLGVQTGQGTGIPAI